MMMKVVANRKWGGAAICVVIGLGAIGCGDNRPSDNRQSIDGVDPPSEAPASQGSGELSSAPRNRIRPLSPLSGSISGSRQPLFRYTPPRAATVQICDDRACDHVVAELDGEQGRAQPAVPLRAGLLFWRVVSHGAFSPVWELTLPGRDTGASIAWGVVPDFNGDGLADVAIGSPAPGSQYVAIFNGSPFGPGFTPDVTLTDGALFGRAVASAGDINGDGFVDLAVASGSAPGAVTVYLGGAAGPGGTGTVLSPGDVTSGFGDTMASAGDVNGDGYGDLLVGGLEHAQVYLGSSAGLATTAAFSLVGSTANGASGDATVVQGPSDVNADGTPDLFVGNALYLSSPGGLTAQADFSIFLPGSFAGDENGDGFGDFASEQVSPGTPEGVDTRRFLFSQAGESTMGTAGDVNGDGYSDIISSLSAIENFGDRQRVYFGAPGSCGSTGCRGYLSIPIPGHDFMGGDLTAFLGGVGDANGDGLDDLVASTPENGSAYFFRSETAGTKTAFDFPSWKFAPGFGSSFAALFGTVRPLF